MAINQFDINKFISTTKSKYKNILQTLIMEKSIDYDNDNKEILHLITILIKKSQRNKGYGNAVMSEIINFSNQYQIPIVLKASNLYGSDLNRLFTFYRKNDFFPIGDDKMKYLPKKI